MPQQQPRKNAWHPLLGKLMQFAVSNPKLARKLLEDHPEALDLRTGLGETALHYLAVENYADAVQLLIDLGADPNVTNEFGATPLEEATQLDAQQTIDVLRRAGAIDKQAPIDDGVLGRVTFDVKSGDWRFTLPIGDHNVPGKITPTDRHRPIAPTTLAEIRQTIAWIRDNEPAIRDHITTHLFDSWLANWHDPQRHPLNTREPFRETLHLQCLEIAEDVRATFLRYDAGDLFASHAIHLWVDAAADHFICPPELWPVRE